MGQQLPALATFTDGSGSSRTTEHISPAEPIARCRVLVGPVHPRRTCDAKHSLGNLVLTLDNSSYGNKCFDLKRGVPLEPGSETRPCYAQGKLKQERELAQYREWTPATIESRQLHLAQWALSHWSVEQPTTEAVVAVDDDDEIEPEVEDDTERF